MSPEAARQEQPDWERIASMVDRAREAVGEGGTFGTVSVAYDQPAWDSGQVYVRAECHECGANSVMRVSDATHLRYLAETIMRYDCPPRGHHPNLVLPTDQQN